MLLEQGQTVTEDLLDDAVDLGSQLRAKQVADRATLDFENLVEEGGEPLVECLSKLGLPEHAGQVLLGEEPVAHRAAYGGGESGLVLGDCTLKKPQPATAQRRRSVRMEEHPDRDRVRQAPRQGSDHNGHDGPQQYFVHRCWCRRKPFTATRLSSVFTVPSTS